MGEAKEVQLQIRDQESGKPTESMLNENMATVTSESSIASSRSYVWWLKMAIYSILVLAGQATATLLGRLYFLKGGNCKWIECLVQTMGFPILIPVYFYLSRSDNSSSSVGAKTDESPALLTVRAPLYLSFGVLFAGAGMLGTVALQYLPVSTYALIVGGTPLAFNAFFAYFMNAQKFTPLIINSLVLLTLSSVLLVIGVNSRQSSSKVSEGKYAIGFICAFVSAAVTGLYFNIVQLCFRKVFKGNPLKMIFEMSIWTTTAATCIFVVGLFASGEWRHLQTENRSFALGEVSYIMDLAWTAICWQLVMIGMTGLIFEVSSVFANVISVLGLPIVPVLAVFFFHEKMDGVKAIALILSIWGFISYVYQHYLDGKSSKTVQEKDASTAEE